MTCDRDHVYINGQAVRHTVACRDWICSECGSTLATRWFDMAPHWRTVCVNDPSHTPDGFVHQSTWGYLQGMRQLATVQAKEVLRHLPPELQDAIRAID